MQESILITPLHNISTLLILEIPTALISGFDKQEFTKDQQALENKKFEIECSFLGYPKPNVAWFLDGYNLPK